MEERSHPWHFKYCSYMISNCCAKFQISCMNKSVSRTSPSSSVTWRTLRVPDWRQGGHRSSLTSKLFLGYHFQPRCQMIGSVSRTPCSSGGYLEDFEGSWQETEEQGHFWNHGSPCWTPRKTPWRLCFNMYMFGRIIKICYHGNKNVTNRQTNRQTDRQTLVKFI